MRVVCRALFHDIEADVDRNPGDEFEVTPERLAAINSAGFGELARAVEEAPEAKAPKAAPRRTRKAKAGE